MKRIGRWTGYLINEEKGGMLILVAVLMVVLLGMSALAVDAGSLYQTRREMVNAADATALAGAQEYYYDSNWANVKKYAEEFAYDNYGCDPLQEEVIVEAVGSNGVKVTTVRNVEYTFARFLGMTDSDVVASATAIFASLSKGNIIPIGLKASTFNNMTVGVSHNFVIFDDEFGYGAGNWGWVSFNTKNPDNAHTTREYLETGYDAEIPDTLLTNPGANIVTPSYEDELRQLLDSYIEDETELWIPITDYNVDDLPESGSKEVPIIGFAIIVLSDYTIATTGGGGTPKLQRIEGSIVSSEYIDVGQIHIDGPVSRFVPSGVALID